MMAKSARPYTKNFNLSLNPIQTIWNLSVHDIGIFYQRWKLENLLHFYEFLRNYKIDNNQNLISSSWLFLNLSTNTHLNSNLKSIRSIGDLVEFWLFKCTVLKSFSQKQIIKLSWNFKILILQILLQWNLFSTDPVFSKNLPQRTDFQSPDLFLRKLCV